MTRLLLATAVTAVPVVLALAVAQPGRRVLLGVVYVVSWAALLGIAKRGE